MIYSEENKTGEITINKSVIQDIITESIRPWVYTGKLRVLSNKNFQLTDKGVSVELHFSVAMGESTNEILSSVSNGIASAVKNSLEMDLDDIIIYIDSMFTKKGTLVQRDIQFSFNESKK